MILNSKTSWSSNNWSIQMILTVLNTLKDTEGIISYLVRIGRNKLSQALFLVCRICPFPFCVMFFSGGTIQPRNIVKADSPKNGEYNIYTRVGARFDSINSPNIPAWNQFQFNSETNLNHLFKTYMDNWGLMKKIRYFQQL